MPFLLSIVFAAGDSSLVRETSVDDIHEVLGSLDLHHPLPVLSPACSWGSLLTVGENKSASGDKVPLSPPAPVLLIP